MATMEMLSYKSQQTKQKIILMNTQYKQHTTMAKGYIYNKLNIFVNSESLWLMSILFTYFLKSFKFGFSRISDGI